MKTESRCLYNPKMKCSGAYWSHKRGMEVISCWQDNQFFLADLEWLLTGRGFDESKKWVLCTPPRDLEFEMLRKAKIYGYFMKNDFDGMTNTLEIIEPWIKDRWFMTAQICRVMKNAEKRFLKVRLDEIIEVGERILKGG